MKVIPLTSLVFAAIVSSLSSLPAWSQSYPVKPIRVVITFTPGGVLDQIVHLVGPKLTEAWGQQVLMDHRPGAGGVIGTDVVAKAAPDGHTLLVGSIGPSSISPALNPNLPYDPVKDFSAISLAIAYPNMLVVNPSLPVNSVGELIALAKAKPGQLNFASSGAGASNHLAAELLNIMAGIKLVHVPYKGQMPALNDTISGQVQVSFANVGVVLPFVKAGRLRALGVTSAKRSPVIPDQPSIAESGVPGYEIITWAGLWAPAGTPRDILAKLNSETVKALRNPEVQKAFLAQGVETTPTTPEQADAFLKSEIVKWAGVVKAANIKVD